MAARSGGEVGNGGGSGGRTSIPDSVAQAVSGLSDGMSALVRAHLQLARVEMAADLRTIIRDLVIGLGGTPLVMVGYLLMWIAVGYLLALVIPAWAAFGICSGVNFVGGLGLMLWGRARTRRDKLDLPVSSHELKRDRDWLTALKEPPNALRDHLVAGPDSYGEHVH